MGILREQLAAHNERQERERRAAEAQPAPADGAPRALVLQLDAATARGLEALGASLGMHPTRLAEQLLRDAVVNRYGAPS